MRTRSLTLLIALAAALPAPALAASGPLFTGLPATATTQHGAFSGTVSVHRFTAGTRGLRARVLIAGTLHDTRYPQDVTFQQPAAVAVRIRGHGCSATVAIGGRVQIWGLPGVLAARRVRVGAAAGCRLRHARGAGAQARALERLRRAHA